MRCPCAFRLRRLAQNVSNGFVSSEGLVVSVRHACFLSRVQGVALWGHSRSQTLFCVTGAGHRTLFRPCGRRDAFWTLLKRWQAWVKMRGALIFGELGRRFERVSFCESVVIFYFGGDEDSVWQVQNFGCLELIFRGRQAQYFVHLDKKVAET